MLRFTENILNNFKTSLEMFYRYWRKQEFITVVLYLIRYRAVFILIFSSLKRNVRCEVLFRSKYFYRVINPVILPLVEHFQCMQGF